jgi:hypothetical protein
MKREKFLWPITHAHHYGLMAAKAIQRKLEEKPAKKELEKLRRKAGRFFEADLASHIGLEEEMLGQLAYHTSPADPFVEKARREHRELRGLLKKEDARSLELFADKLIRHIYFEEDELFREVEEQFTQAEKEWVETEVKFNIQDWPKTRAFLGN